jgi:glycosyltransferase involved in cell wall biosynthesis
MNYRLLSPRYWLGIHAPRLNAINFLRPASEKPNVWHSEGNDPIFSLEFDENAHPTGWVIVKIAIEALDGSNLKPCLYVDDGLGYREESKEPLPMSNRKGLRHIIQLPPKVYSLRFDPTDGVAKFQLKSLTIRSVGTFELWAQLAILFLRQRVSAGRHPVSLAKNGAFLVRHRRFGFIKDRLLQAYRNARKTDSYDTWIRITEASSLDAVPRGALERLKSEKPPLISILISTYNTPEVFLRAAIDSVLKQSYEHWELCIADDASSDEAVRSVLREYGRRDRRIKLQFRPENGNISAGLNAALGMAAGSFMTVLDHDDCLSSRALEWVAHTILEQPDVDYIYSDEDKISAEGSRFGPFFKPDWSPEYMLSMMYTCHMSVFRTSLVKKLGGYRSAFDGAQDYDLTLRVVAQTDNIYHIPHVLYHWRVWSNSTAMSLDAKPYALQRQKRALTEYLQSKQESFVLLDHELPGHHRIVFMPKRSSLVSIVIPTANGQIDLDGQLERHIDAVVASIEQKTSYESYEIIIVHNGDLTAAQLARFERDPRITLVTYSEKVFSLSRKINLGAKAARGEFLVLLNDDIRVISHNWIELMLGMAQREGVGAVGAKLLFPNNTVQHFGVTILNGSPGHPYYGEHKDSFGYWLGLQVDQNYIAVTGACQMTRLSLFLEMGGYSESFPLNYNDVDYCLRLHQKGYRMVCMANAHFFHYEGVSKEGGRSVGADELKNFVSRWSTIYQRDPYYSPNLSQAIPFTDPW